MEFSRISDKTCPSFPEFWKTHDLPPNTLVPMPGQLSGEASAISRKGVA